MFISKKCLITILENLSILNRELDEIRRVVNLLTKEDYEAQKKGSPSRPEPGAAKWL